MLSTKIELISHLDDETEAQRELGQQLKPEPKLPNLNLAL